MSDEMDLRFTFGIVIRFYVFLLLSLPLFLNAQRGVLQLYQYSMGDNFDESACNVPRSFDGRMYFSPYAHGLYELRNDGISEIASPPGCSVYYIGALVKKKRLLGTNQGLWVLSKGNKLECIDSSYVYDMQAGFHGYYIVLKSKLFSSKLVYLDSALTRYSIWEGNGVYSLHYSKDTLFGGLQEDRQLKLFYLKELKMKFLRSLAVNSETSFLLRVLKSDSLIIGSYTADLSLNLKYFNGSRLIRECVGKHFQSFGIQSYITELNPGIGSINFFNSHESLYIQTTTLPNRFQYKEQMEIGSIFIPSKSMVTRAFTYLKQFPKLFDHEHSNLIFSLVEAQGGQVIAASNEKGVTSIYKDKYRSLLNYNIPITNGAFRINKWTVLIPEPIAKKKFLLFDERLHVREINMPPSAYFYYGFCSSQNQIYLGSNEKGLWCADVKSFLDNKPEWVKIDSSQSGKLINILTISEDTLNRIWFAHPRTGFGLYNPKTRKTRYFLTEKKDIAFGAMASLCDSNGTMWFGTQPGGIAWYNAYNDTIHSKEIHWIHHPLLNDVPRVTALSISMNHLIIAAYDKILALDLAAFYSGRLNIKYLTKQELNLTSYTEQNTLITTRDSCVWFSSHDKLYQWNFRQWLKIPKNKIEVFPQLSLGLESDTLHTHTSRTLSPLQNNFSIHLDYYHSDLLPRYFRIAMQYGKENIKWSKCSTESNFSFINLKSGVYTFHLQVMELDGTLSAYHYSLIIDDFWYMKWWIWLLLGISLSGAIIYVMKLNVERRVAQMALALEREVKLAEIDHVKSMKERELARLKLRSIANQIRPHFILNALNTIGASLPLKSKAERLLNLLSGNLNKLFDQSVSERNTQTLESEWLQCVDTIEMNRIIYLPELRIIEDLHLEEFKSIIIPIGLLHIPIENALLHGLRNRISGPYELSIHSECSEEYLTIEIVDNGIGIKVSRLQSNARKHGSGLKNIWESLSIYNNLNENHLSLVIDDKMENGTRVKIQIPLNYTYEI